MHVGLYNFASTIFVNSVQEKKVNIKIDGEAEDTLIIPPKPLLKNAA